MSPEQVFPYRLAALLAGLVMITGQSVMAQELPDGFWKEMIDVKSDHNLNSARIACAFGDMPKIVRRVKAKGVDTQIVPADYCPEVVAEAVKRGNDADLYTSLQHSKANEELKQVLLAAAGDKQEYLNAEGKKRAMTCQLAFDIGYIYGDANRDETILPDLTAADMKHHLKRCFDGLVKVSIQNTFWVAARYAQLHAR